MYKTLLPNCPMCTKFECMDCDPDVLDLTGNADLEVISNLENTENNSKDEI